MSLSFTNAPLVVDAMEIVLSSQGFAVHPAATFHTGRETSGLTMVSLQKNRVLLFGAVNDARKLCDDVCALVDRVSLRERDERIAEAGTGAVTLVRALFAATTGLLFGFVPGEIFFGACGGNTHGWLWPHRRPSLPASRQLPVFNWTSKRKLNRPS